MPRCKTSWPRRSMTCLRNTMCQRSATHSEPQSRVLHLGRSRSLARAIACKGARHPWQIWYIWQRIFYKLWKALTGAGTESPPLRHYFQWLTEFFKTLSTTFHNGSSCVAQFWGLHDHFRQARLRLAFGFFESLRVAVHCRLKGRMTQELLDNLRVDA